MKSWIKHGSRVIKVKTYDNRWGLGKVHYLKYHKSYGCYVFACRKPTRGEVALGGVSYQTLMEKTEPLTCMLCQRWEKVGS